MNSFCFTQIMVYACRKTSSQFSHLELICNGPKQLSGLPKFCTACIDMGHFQFLEDVPADDLCCKAPS